MRGAYRKWLAEDGAVKRLAKEYGIEDAVCIGND